MTKEEKEYIKDVVDHFVDMYRLDLKPYYKAYEIWFQKNMTKEILLDFLKRLNIPANVRVERIKKNEMKESGSIIIPGSDGIMPVLFNSQEFQSTKFVIKINELCYREFSTFIRILIHELSHLVLHSTNNKYRKSEVATDLFVMCFGLFDQIESPDREGYITEEQIIYAQKYIELKRTHMESHGIEKFILKMKIKFF